MRIVRPGIVLMLSLAMALTFFLPGALAASDSAYGDSLRMTGAAEQLFALANQTRANYGLGALKWDPALAAGALQHCMRMTQGGALSHQYRGEPDVTLRA